MSSTITHAELITHLADICSTLHHVKGVKFLRSVNPRDFLSVELNRSEQIIEFFRIVLDIAGIISATGGNFQQLSLGDCAILGNPHDLRGILKGKDNQIDDWMCSTLFQGWTKDNSSTLRISNDMRYVVKNESKVCDFIVEAKGGSTLVECKRIHPVEKKNSKTEVLAKVQEKMAQKIEEARVQFENTPQPLGEDQYYSLVIMDISAYGYVETLNKKEMNILGFTQPVIDDLANSSKEMALSGINGLCLCWSNLFYFENLPRALAYYTKLVNFKDNLTCPINYEGWTVEFYPLSRNVREYKELRISGVARTHDWIRASWHSSIDNLVWGGRS